VLFRSSDLSDREPVFVLQRFVKWGNGKSICLLFNCPGDDIVILVLYKSIFGENKNGNKLMLFYHNDLIGLIRYFRPWLDTLEEDNIHFKPVKEITRLLYDQWTELNDNSTQLEWMG
jgi:hypothetical protein